VSLTSEIPEKYLYVGENILNSHPYSQEFAQYGYDTEQLDENQ
jgi:hypothetical protein